MLPTEEQTVDMKIVRQATAAYAKVMEDLLPIGPDKTYILRKIREVGMWANVTITREADGTPRK